MSDLNAKAAKFVRNDEQVHRDWLRLLIENPHAPLDVAYKASLIHVGREYYPYAQYDLTCVTSWSAKSIWEHKEERQVPVTKYQDYSGKLHDRSGTDTEVYNGHYFTHSRKVVTVYETETFTVVDNVQQTSGKVGPAKLTEKVWLGPSDGMERLLNWAENFPANQFVPFGTVAKDVTIIPESKSQSAAQNEAAEQASGILTARAKREVPGTRYENFRITGFNVQNVSRIPLYLPVFHVRYSYEGQKYECFMTGGNTQSDALAFEQPSDEAIKEHHEGLNKAIEDNDGCSQFGSFILSLILGGLGLFTLLPNAIVPISSAFSNGIDLGSLLFGIAFLVPAVICIGIAVKSLMKFFAKRKNHREAKSTKAKVEADSLAIKQQILDLIYNDTIPEEQKAQMIQEWITAFEASNLAGVGK